LRSVDCSAACNAMPGNNKNNNNNRFIHIYGKQFESNPDNITIAPRASSGLCLL
jgi:hypothetical protein